MAETDVIAALATASGRSAVGIIRLSGPDLMPFMSGLLGRQISPRRAVLSDFLDAERAAIDSGLALFFPAPHSYTGEDVLELQAHGGPAVLQALLGRCVALGARLAQPGEFTRRAFLNDKMDLAQAESVADLIEAGSEAAARAAVRSLKGELSGEVRALVSELVALRARVEASIDFPDEDVDPGDQQKWLETLEIVRDRIERIRGMAASGNLLRDGIQVVLVGQPNVGKSSLLNRLSGEELAIVTAVPGTTRDAVRGEFLLEGITVRVTDTAGLREARDPVERMGIERTWRAAEASDVVLLVVDARAGRTAEDDLLATKLPRAAKHITIFNKIDLTGCAPSERRVEGTLEVQVSALTGAGIDLLRQAILEEVAPAGLDLEGVFLARERHLDALSRAAVHLRNASGRLIELEVFAEELRLAQRALGEITGELSADDLLGEIFSKFCIGK